MSDEPALSLELSERYVVHLEKRLRIAEARTRSLKALVWFLTPLLTAGLLLSTCLALHFSSK